MSQDGKAQAITKRIKNNRPVTKDVICSCGGTFYALNSASFARCSSGATHCTRCRRTAYRFGKGLTCGPGCQRVTNA